MSEPTTVPRLTSLTLMVTDRCDQSCSFCYAKYKPATELSLEEIKTVLDQAMALGAVYLVITGGDPYRRKDLHEIIAAGHKRDFAILLKTHGMHIDATEASWLSEHGVRRVDLSVHSHRAEGHDSVTRVPGSFERTKAAAEHLKTFGVRVNLSLVATRNNITDIPKALEEFAAEFPVTVGFSMGPTLLGSKAPIENQAMGEALIRARMNVLDYGPRSGCMPEGYSEPEDDDVPCQAGRRLAAVFPDGNVTPCVVYPRVLGNVRDNDLQTIWMSQEALTLRSETYADHHECGGCEAKPYCNFCPGYSYTERGAATKASQTHCVPAYALKEAVSRKAKALAQPGFVGRQG
jgi:radical SAM protein with 4Fe4S-binding SPASM domain